MSRASNASSVARTRSSRSTAGMLRNLSVARRERSRLAPPSRGGGTAPFARSPADAPEIAVSPVGRNRTRLPTILVVLLGRPVACPEPGSAMLSRLAVQYRGEVD